MLGPLPPEYVFWIVAIGFYVVDCVQLVPRDRLLFSENIRGRMTPVLSLNDFELRGCRVHLVNFLTPFFCAFKISCAIDTVISDASINRDNRRIKIFQGRTKYLRLVSSAMLVLLLLGPILTYQFGFYRAITLIVPFHLTLYVAGSIIVFKNRKKLNLERKKLLSIMFDVLVVPGYFCNLIHRLSLFQNFSGNGYYYALNFATPEERKEIEFFIERRIEQEIDICSIHNQSLSGDYEKYREKLLGAHRGPAPIEPPMKRTSAP